MDYNLEGGGRKGYSFYAPESISEHLGGNPSPRSVERHLKTLEEYGWITQRWNGHRTKGKFFN